MAHYAILNNNNIVIDVIVGKDENETLPDGYSSWEEYYGGKRTSYNTIGNTHKEGKTPFRKNFAGIGYTYDEQFDAFIPPRPYNSWKFDYQTFLWKAPVPQPQYEVGYVWLWSEVNQEWIKYPVS